MVVVGLTGGIGSGKSTVSSLLAQRGAIVIDADEIAREVLEPERPAYRTVIERFGRRVLQPDGRLDRSAIASMVFSDPEALTALNAITHPPIADVIRSRLREERASDHRVVLDIPLLTEPMRSAYGLAGVIMVDAPVEVAIARLVEQRGYEPDDARARMAAQISCEQRRRLADIVVDNSGSRSELERSVDMAWVWIMTLDPASDETG